MYIDLKGQAAIVTGASSGLGRAIAIQHARAGARVAVNYHSDKVSADAIVAEIVEGGGEAFACHADTAKEDDVNRSRMMPGRRSLASSIMCAKLGGYLIPASGRCAVRPRNISIRG